jgi:microcystin-dependent protein
MSEAFIGQLMLVGFNFAPRSWALCNGQLLAINTNTALFSLLGTQYGGNGTTTFALPDLRGRVPLHFGQGPGLSNQTQGGVAGVESLNLTTNQLPAHSHAIPANAALGSTAKPAGAVASQGGSYSPTSDGTKLADPALTGSNAAVSIMQPYLVLNWIICLQGIFPSRGT